MGGGSRKRTADSVPRALVDAMQGSKSPKLSTAFFVAEMFVFGYILWVRAGSTRLFQLAVVVMCGLAALQMFLFFRRMRTYKRLLRLTRAHRGLVCPECGYPHDREEAEVVCPECGATIDVARAKERWARVENL